MRAFLFEWCQKMIGIKFELISITFSISRQVLAKGFCSQRSIMRKIIERKRRRK